MNYGQQVFDPMLQFVDKQLFGLLFPPPGSYILDREQERGTAVGGAKHLAGIKPQSALP